MGTESVCTTRKKRCAALMLIAFACGCAGDPEFQHPVVDTPVAFSSGSSATTPAVTSSWWRLFGDPALDRLVARALAGNPAMSEAAARVRQARARERIVAAGDAPHVNGAGQAGYTRISEHAIPQIPGSGTTESDSPFGLPGTDFTTFRAGFDASWEADLFGGSRHERTAAAERTDAELWSGRDVQVTLAAEVADTYLRYRTLQQRILLADRRIECGRELLEFVEARARSGLATTAVVRRQERALAETRASREALIAERDVMLHALAVLAGEPPLALAEELAASNDIPSSKLDVPVGLPSELLLRRPDLRAAEDRLAAAVSDIGTARAALFPKIGLTGAVHLVSTSLSQLLLPGSLQLNTAASLNLPVLDGGRRRATVDLRRAEAEEAAEAYRARVIDALRDVEDALARLEADRQRETLLVASEDAARDMLETAHVRHRNGLTPFMEVLEAQQMLIGAQEAALQARADTAAAMVSLHKALGGGWEMEERHE